MLPRQVVIFNYRRARSRQMLSVNPVWQQKLRFINLI
jgi:hypothetical protein